MMEDALYQWDANASAFVPFTGVGPAADVEYFDAKTIRSIAEQGDEAGYGAQVVAAALRFVGGPVADEAASRAPQHRPEYVQVALGELGEAPTTSPSPVTGPAAPAPAASAATVSATRTGATSSTSRRSSRTSVSYSTGPP